MSQVDVFYNGHKHIFYRTCPIRFGACATTKDPVTGAIKGTVYVTAGNAGVRLPLLASFFTTEGLRPPKPGRDGWVIGGARCSRKCVGLPKIKLGSHKYIA